MTVNGYVVRPAVGFPATSDGEQCSRNVKCIQIVDGPASASASTTQTIITSLSAAASSESRVTCAAAAAAADLVAAGHCLQTLKSIRDR